jgi:hypothetical protein
MRWCLIIQLISYFHFYSSNCHNIYTQESSTMPYRRFVELELSSGLNEIKQYTDLNEVNMSEFKF